MPRKEFTSYQVGSRERELTRLLGSRTTRFPGMHLKCVPMLTEWMILYLNSDGSIRWVSEIKSGSSWRTELEWWLRGVKPDLPVSRYAPVTSKFSDYYTKLLEHNRLWHHIRHKVNYPMATGANERQVGGRHYRSKMQHWDYVLANNIPYLEAQVIKYLTRWRDKGGANDLRKAQHFLQKLFESEGIDWSTELPESGAEPGPGYVDQARDKSPVDGRQTPTGASYPEAGPSGYCRHGYYLLRQRCPWCSKEAG